MAIIIIIIIVIIIIGGDRCLSNYGGKRCTVKCKYNYNYRPLDL